MKYKHNFLLEAITYVLVRRGILSLEQQEDFCKLCSLFSNKGGAVTSVPDSPGSESSLMVDDGEVGTPATLVIALAAVFLILTLAATLIAYVIYRRRYSIHTLLHVYRQLFEIGDSYFSCP